MNEYKGYEENIFSDNELESTDIQKMFNSEQQYIQNKKKKINITSKVEQYSNYDSEEEVMEFINEECNQNNHSIDSDIEIFEDFNLPNEKAWGAKKKSFYSTDYIDADYSCVNQKDIDSAVLEEKEAKNLQKQLSKFLDETDFGLDALVKDYQFDDNDKLIKTDLSQLSKRQKQELLRKESPEFISLLADFYDRILEIRMILSPFIKLATTKNYNNCFIINFIKIKYNLILHYCTHISFYLMFKTKRQFIFNHPIIKALIQYRQLLSKIEEQENLYDKIKKIMKFNKTKRNTNFTDYKKIQMNTNSQITNSKQYKNIENNKLKEIATVTNNIILTSKRAITYQISKNKGLIPYRKKEQRNPRIKHRNKYRKAKIHRKGAVREIRKETNRYGGEIFGIKTNVKKSVLLK